MDIGRVSSPAPLSLLQQLDGTRRRQRASRDYMSNGSRMNSSGTLANPTRSAQVAANNAGALTRHEASRMGLPLGGRR